MDDQKKQVIMRRDTKADPLYLLQLNQQKAKVLGDPTKKLYLILAYLKDPSEDRDGDKTFEITHGRKETYQWLKDRIDILDLESTIILATVGIATVDEARLYLSSTKNERVTNAYDFLKVMRDMFNDKLDLEDYEVE